MSHRRMSVRERCTDRLKGLVVALSAAGLALPLLVASGGSSTAVDDVLAAARAQVGDAYLWGGNGPDAWDCSGLTSYVWGAVGGVTGMPRVSGAQQRWAVPIPREQLLPGDLVFLGEPVTHVALFVGDGTVVDASSARAGVVERPLWTASVTRYGRVPRVDMPAVTPWTPPPAPSSAAPTAPPTGTPAAPPVAAPPAVPVSAPVAVPVAAPVVRPGAARTPATRPPAAPRSTAVPVVASAPAQPAAVVQRPATAASTPAASRPTARPAAPRAQAPRAQAPLAQAPLAQAPRPQAPRPQAPPPTAPRPTAAGPAAARPVAAPSRPVPTPPRPVVVPARPVVASARPVAAPRPAVSAAARPLTGLPSVQARPSTRRALAAVVGVRALVGSTRWGDLGAVREAWRRAGGGALPTTHDALVARGQQVARPDVRVGDLVVYGFPARQVYLYVGSGSMAGHSPDQGKVVVRRVHAGDVRFVRLSG